MFTGINVHWYKCSLVYMCPPFSKPLDNGLLQIIIQKPNRKQRDKRMNQKKKKFWWQKVYVPHRLSTFPSHISSRIQCALQHPSFFLMRPSYYWSGFAVPNLKQRLIPNKTICCNFILRKSIFKHVIIGERKYVISSLCTLMDIEYGM